MFLNIRLFWDFKVPHHRTICFLASVQYRQIQILVLLTNICLQLYILPSIQFIGSVIIIALLFSILIFGHYLPMWTTFLLSLTFVVAIIAVWFVLNMGSQPILKSSKVLKKWRLYNRECNCKWTRKFVRSCPNVVLRMGSFHTLDRSRAPSLMRFVLQRTFFLVKSTGNVCGISMSLPQ